MMNQPRVCSATQLPVETFDNFCISAVFGFVFLYIHIVYISIFALQSELPMLDGQRRKKRNYSSHSVPLSVKQNIQAK